MHFIKRQYLQGRQKLILRPKNSRNIGKYYQIKIDVLFMDDKYCSIQRKSSIPPTNQQYCRKFNANERFAVY